MNCGCPFHDTLIGQIFPLGDTELKDADINALCGDAENCCCLGFILFLAFRCPDVTDFVASMREAIMGVYGASKTTDAND